MDVKKLKMHENPLSDKIITKGNTSFKLWLEFEETEPWDDPKNDFANVIVDSLDGRKYGINVWTHQFFQTALAYEKQNENRDYIVPPDLFVKELTRGCLEKVIIELFENSDLEDALNPSVFNLHFIEPYLDAFEMEEDEISSLLKELKRELPKKHVLKNQSVELIARDQRNDDIILELENGGIAVVHLTWSSGREVSGFPRTRIYPTALAYWKNEMKDEIADYC